MDRMREEGINPTDKAGRGLMGERAPPTLNHMAGPMILKSRAQTKGGGNRPSMCRTDCSSPEAKRRENHR